MRITSYSDGQINHLGRVLKVLSEPSRLRILCSLGLECRPVTDIVNATGLSQTNVSFHLRILRESGLVRPERRGPFIYYCLPDPELLSLLEALRTWSKRHGPPADQGEGRHPSTAADRTSGIS